MKIIASFALVSLASTSALADTAVVSSPSGTVVVAGATPIEQPTPVETANHGYPAAAPPTTIIAPAPPPAPPRRNTLGVDALGVVPVGDYADLATLGIGASARLEIPAGSGFVTGRLGAIFHSMNDRGADGTSLTLIPAYVGYRYPLAPSGFYLAGEVGVTFAYMTVDTNGFGTASDSDSELGLALMAGLRRGQLDLRAGLFSPDADDAVGLLASAGYDFASF